MTLIHKTASLITSLLLCFPILTASNQQELQLTHQTRGKKLAAILYTLAQSCAHAGNLAGAQCSAERHQAAMHLVGDVLTLAATISAKKESKTQTQPQIIVVQAPANPTPPPAPQELQTRLALIYQHACSMQQSKLLATDYPALAPYQKLSPSALPDAVEKVCAQPSQAAPFVQQLFALCQALVAQHAQQLLAAAAHDLEDHAIDTSDMVIDDKIRLANGECLQPHIHNEKCDQQSILEKEHTQLGELQKSRLHILDIYVSELIAHAMHRTPNTVRTSCETPISAALAKQIQTEFSEYFAQLATDTLEQIV